MLTIASQDLPEVESGRPGRVAETLTGLSEDVGGGGVIRSRDRKLTDVALLEGFVEQAGSLLKATGRGQAESTSDGGNATVNTPIEKPSRRI